MTNNPTLLQAYDAAQGLSWVRAFPDRGTLRVTGADRVAWLNGLLSCDVSKVAPGRAVWGLLLNRVGKIQSEVWVVNAGQALLLSLSPGTADLVLSELDQRLVMEDAELADVSASYRWYFVAGPEGVVRAADYAGAEGFSGALDLLNLGSGAVLALPSGAPVPDIPAVADQAWDVLRIRSCTGNFGSDFDAQDRPHEASLDRRAVAWSKGCYLGQEVVCMQDMRGKVKQALRAFSVDAPQEAEWLKTALRDNQDRAVGEVRSAAYDPQAGRWWLLARVELGALEGGVQATWAGHVYRLNASSQSPNA